MDITKVLAKNLRDAREQKKLSREALAKSAGVTAQTIYDVENENRKPSLTVMDSLAKALEVEVYDLLKVPLEGEVVKIRRQPLKAVLSGLMNIPQDVYEMIEQVEQENEAWDTVRAALEIAIEKKQSHKNEKSV